MHAFIISIAQWQVQTIKKCKGKWNSYLKLETYRANAQVFFMSVASVFNEYLKRILKNTYIFENNDFLSNTISSVPTAIKSLLLCPSIPLPRGILYQDRTPSCTTVSTHSFHQGVICQVWSSGSGVACWQPQKETLAYKLVDRLIQVLQLKSSLWKCSR